ncbi:protein transport protein sec31 isoform X2 [Triticum aestivum]|uniref:protein transport protein sec31 isoform X2 n=1 Tax=Triticum aestivum TaxID=4565 RepID=UPI001D019A34|nr:protein transport protein sec31-like isoform X2 [Triticum aestivum]
MEDKRKAVANNEERRQRQRREREAEAVEDTATSGRTPTAGGNGTSQELPRVTAATTPALRPPPVASSQFDNGRPQHAQIGNAGAPQGHGSTVIDQQRLRDQPSSSRARAPGCTCCGGAPTTRVVLNLPVCEACYRRFFHAGAPQQHAQIGYAGAPRGAVRNPVAVPTREQQFLANMDAPPRPFSMFPFRWGPANPALERQSSSPARNGPPQQAQIRPPPLHTLAPPPERQSSSRAREQQLQAQADAMRLQVANILNNPFSLVRSGPANPAPQRQSSSPGCYSNIFTGNGPLFSSAGARAPQAQGHGTAIDQQRQLDLLRGQPSSSQARAPGCSSCGARATRVALKMPFCDACFRDTFMANAPPPQHTRIGSMLPSPVPSYNYAQTGTVRPQHTLAGNVSSSPVPTPSNVHPELPATPSPSSVPTPSNAGAPQGQQQHRDSVVELLAATEPSPPAGSQRAAYSRCEACRLSGDKACMFCHNPGPPPPPPGQS